MQRKERICSGAAERSDTSALEGFALGASGSRRRNRDPDRTASVVGSVSSASPTLVAKSVAPFVASEAIINHDVVCAAARMHRPPAASPPAHRSA